MEIKRYFKEYHYWLIGIFLLVLAIRIFIVFQNPQFNYEAYFSLRQIENIKSTGLPLYNDPLSYGGKTQLFAPLYYYILTIFSLIFPTDLVAKILPNIFAALLTVLTYYIALKITKSNKISLTTSFMSGFIPILFLDINKISVDYLSLLLIFGIIYCIFRINDRKYVDYALILIFLLVLTTPLAFILILGLLFYLLLLKLENLQTAMKELEIILFFTFLVFWVNLLIYKNAFLSHGLLVVWQNIPLQILSNFFDKLTFLETFYTISIIPLILGVYAFYIAFYKEKNKEVLLLIGFGISSFLLLWFKLLTLVTGLVYLSVTLVILTSFALKHLSEFVQKTKIYRYQRLMLVLMIILFVITAIVPSVLMGIEKCRIGPATTDIEALEWASINIPKNATISSSLEEGNIVTYFAKRKNIMDINFLLTPKIDQRLDDLDTIYNSKFETEAVNILNKYNTNYIFLSTFVREKYSIEDPEYIKDKNCFTKVYYSNSSDIYYSKCKIS